jgi:ATP-dependent RNA helicase DDX1
MSGGFASLGLMPEILQSISDLGWQLPTDIQDESIPLILGGGDVMAAAETGSGKTGAFCLPIIQSVHERLVSLSQPASTSKGNASKAGSNPAKGSSIRISGTDKDAVLEVDESGLSCDSTAATDVYCGARATHGVKTGRYFYECIVSGSGICRVGWSTVAAHLELGKDKHGYGYGSTGFKSNGGFEKYGDGKFQNGDAVGCYIDLVKREVSYSRNGAQMGKAFDIPQEMVGSVFFPAVLLKNSELMVNFGEHPFKFAPALPNCTALFKAPADQLLRADSNAVFVTTGKRKPLALIIEPTRDLAEQVYQALKDFTKYVRQPTLECAIATGGGENPGAGEGKIEKRLKEGVDILVGTMGKLSGLVKSGALDLSNIRFFVLDEADRLLSNDSLEAVLELFNKCPGGGTGQHRLQVPFSCCQAVTICCITEPIQYCPSQVCFFSATLHSPEIRRLAERICQNATWVDLKGTDTVPTTVHHVVVRVDPSTDLHYCSEAPYKAVTDGMHAAGVGHKRSLGADSTPAERSQAVKEIKQHLLIRLIDKYEVPRYIHGWVVAKLIG